MQKILLIAVCFITLGLATEPDFIEHESELQDGFVFGEGWSWIEQITSEEDEFNLYKSGKSGKSGKSDKSDKSGKSGKSDKSSSDSSSSSSGSSSGSDSDSDSDSDGKDKVS